MTLPILCHEDLIAESKRKSDKGNAAQQIDVTVFLASKDYCAYHDHVPIGRPCYKSKKYATWARHTYGDGFELYTGIQS